MLKIGITGGIGSGKTFVCKILETMRIPVFNSDWEAKQLMQENLKVQQKLISSFGSEFYSSKNILNKEWISNQIFKNKDKLAEMNSIVHPAVRERFFQWIDSNLFAPIIVKEAAILLESDAHKDLDCVVLVSAPLETRINRCLKRDNAAKEQVENRINNQWSDAQRRTMVDFEIINDEEQPLLPQIQQLLTKVFNNIK